MSAADYLIYRRSNRSWSVISAVQTVLLRRLLRETDRAQTISIATLFLICIGSPGVFPRVCAHHGALLHRELSLSVHLHMSRHQRITCTKANHGRPCRPSKSQSSPTSRSRNCPNGFAPWTLVPAPFSLIAEPGLLWFT